MISSGSSLGCGESFFIRSFDQRLPKFTSDINPAVFKDAVYFVLVSLPGGSGGGSGQSLSQGIDDCGPMSAQIQGVIYFDGSC